MKSNIITLIKRHYGKLCKIHATESNITINEKNLGHVMNTYF